MPNGTVQITAEEWAEVQKTIAVLRDRSHKQAEDQQREVARSYFSAKGEAPKPDVPLWLKIAGTALAALVAIAVLGGIYNSVVRQDAVTLARIAALEAWKIESATANIPMRMQTLEAGIETARRIRDQQQQGMTDRMRALEIADQAGSERLNTVLQQLASITAQLQAQAARTEELLRRQDRLENRLGARPGAAPPQDQPTSLLVPLVWRVPHLD